MWDLKIFVVLLFLGVHVSGWDSNGQSCSHYDYQPQPDSCDPNTYLVCGRNRVCQCPVDMTWIHSYQRCVFKIDSECSGEYQGGNQPGCPPLAICPQFTRQCTCQQPYKPTRDKTGCTNGAFPVHVPGIWIIIASVAPWTTKKLIMF